MRYYSIFSGVEAATLAWEPMGWEPVVFCEVDEFPSAVLRERWPDVPNLGDITKVNWKRVVREYGAADLVVGESFSIAGKRNGLEGASGLMWEYVRCVRELMPRWLLWENVPGALSSTHGEDFGCLLRELDALGYGLAWRVLDAQFFGVAQRRERLFLVGRLGDVERPCKVLFELESLSWGTPSSREKRAELAADAGRGAEAAGGALNPAVMCMTDTQPHSMVDGEVCGALTATMHNDPPVVGFAANQRGEVRLQGVADGYAVRRLTPRECERLMGFPDDWTRVPYRGRTAEECPDTPRYKAIGNSMAVPVMRWIGKRIQEVADDADLR